LTGPVNPTIVPARENGATFTADTDCGRPCWRGSGGDGACPNLGHAIGARNLFL